MNDNLRDAIKAMPSLPQRQDGTMDQLRDLERVAVKLGMYDAADQLKGMVKRYDEQVEKINEKKT